MLKFKPLFAIVLGLALGVAAAHAEPPSSPGNAPSSTSAPSVQSDGQNLTERSLNAVSEAASKIGDVISSGALAFGSGVQRVTNQTSLLIEYARQAIGVRYRWGGVSAQTGFDCSGFVRAVVQQTIGRLLPHHAADQAAVTQTISKDQLQPGDLVFFHTIRRRPYSHVGIYMGDGRFIHAPSRGQFVRIDSLSQAYWQKRFEGARRVLTGEPSSGYSLVSADAPDSGAPVALSLAAVPDATTSNNLAGTVNVASAAPLDSASVTATPRTGNAQPSAPPRSRLTAAKRGRSHKQIAAHHGGRRSKLAINSQKQGNDVMSRVLRPNT